jgi:hypothetical protein
MKQIEEDVIKNQKLSIEQFAKTLDKNQAIKDSLINDKIDKMELLLEEMELKKGIKPKHPHHQKK